MAATTINNASYQDDLVDGTEALQIQERYGKERAKRLRPEGTSQYIDLTKSDKFRHLQEDPWLKESAAPSLDASQNGTECQVLILGAGFGGLQAAARCIEAGLDVKGIRLVDSAGGFGGTWYWNRFPGLMCDVESYIYMPLLEETGYMPKHKYAYGTELREHSNRIAEHYKFTDKAFFQTKMTSMDWDEQTKRWVVNMTQKRGSEEDKFQIKAQFVITASGGLQFPQIPNLPGLEEFKGYSFHTSRWHYNYTGGSDTDQRLENLKDKNVAIIGTGATAIQSVPHLAKWAKHLYVFQRTPSAVDERKQHATDPEWWEREIKGQKGWQVRRNENFLSQYTDEREPNWVNDGFSNMASYRAVAGGPGVIKPEEAPEYIKKLHAMDLPRQERVRARVDQIVKDKTTAENLKAWYPGWCKRPCFHDDYLPAFNQPNVTLVDTNGKGVDALTANAVVFDKKEYPIDLLVFSTGYYTPIGVGPAERASMSITGRNNHTLTQRAVEGLNALHGLMTADFPNLFWAGIAQAGFNPNQTYSLDTFAQHVAAIIVEATSKAGDGKAVAVEAKREAQDEWAMAVASRAAAMAAMGGCTPSYFNLEGAADQDKSEEEQLEAAKQAPWGEGSLDYRDVIERWRKQGMQGLEITVA